MSSDPDVQREGDTPTSSVRFQVFRLRGIKRPVDDVAVSDQQANEVHRVVLLRIFPLPPVGFKTGNRNSGVQHAAPAEAAINPG